ncbi:hypothetical protein ABPG72_015526 [Tetrahymena utriculariae]
MYSNNSTQQRGVSSNSQGNGAGSYTMIMKNTNSLNFYNNLQPSTAKGESNNLNQGTSRNQNGAQSNVSGGGVLNENSSNTNFYSHQPKVIGRSNMEFLNGFSNLGNNQNNASGLNQISSSISAINLNKKESPKGQPKLFQNFQSLFLNSPTHTQRIENGQSSYNQVNGNGSNSSTQNLLKSNNSKLLFPNSPQGISSSLNAQSQSSQQQQQSQENSSSPYYEFKKPNRTKVNNFFNNEEDSEKNNQPSKNEAKGSSSTPYTSLINSNGNGKIIQENSYPLANQNSSNQQNNLGISHSKKLSKDFENSNSNSQRNTAQAIGNKQVQQGISSASSNQLQQSQIGLTPKQQLNGQATNSINSLLINNTKDNTNSYAYQHMQQMQIQQNQQQQQNGLLTKNQFYRPPSSDRNWRNATLKTMNTTQISNQIKKKEQIDQLRNSYEPSSKSTSQAGGYSSPLSQNNYTKQTFSPRNQSQNPQQSNVQDGKSQLNNYVSKLNRGDDLISQALQSIEQVGSGIKGIMRSGNNDQQDSTIASYQGDNKNESSNNKKDAKAVANSLRNSTVINQNNTIGTLNQNAQSNNSVNSNAYIRSASAQKEYKSTSNLGGYLQASQQQNRPYNLALGNSNNWMPSYQKSSTTKDNKHKNFLFFENSDILNGKQSLTPKNEVAQQNQNNQVNSSRTTGGNGYSRPPSNYNVDLNNSSRQNQQSDQEVVTRVVTPKIPIHQEYYMPGIEKCYRLPLPQDYFSQIYREHFLQTYQGIQYAGLARPANPHDLQQKKVFLKNKQPGKKTIIFDLDETLIHCNENASIPSDVVLSIRFPQGEILDAGINIRPNAVEMLKELSQDFEIVVFTASHSSYAKAVLDHLDPHKRYVHHRFFRDQCIMTPQGVYIKDLRIFADRAMSEMVLVDNAAYSFAFQIENGIPIIPFYENKKDDELKSLTNYLKSLKDVKDVREINKQAFKLHLYSQFDTAQKVYEKIFFGPPAITKIVNPSKTTQSSAQTSINSYFQNKNSPASNIGPFQQKQPSYGKNSNNNNK